jgi:putative tryptophan/tyrosine transport system substrate-binding protein
LDRRRFALGIALALSSAHLRAQSAKPPRIGVLTTTALSSAYRQALLKGLREHGYVEGQNLLVEWRAADGSSARADALAAELVKLPVELIVTSLTPATRAARKATATIPIVMAFAGEPVETGLVKSLARPGGNVTGMSGSSAEVSGKRLATLRGLLPQLSKLVFLVNASDPFSRPFVEESRDAAKHLGLHLDTLDGTAVNDFSSTFAEMKKRGIGAVMVQGSLLSRSRQIAQAALQNRLPAASPQKRFVQDGGLISYGADPLDLVRRSATYVDKILKGAKPAELPVEQPTKFELVLNLKTAKQLGISIPQELLAQVDEFIQ